MALLKDLIIFLLIAYIASRILRVVLPIFRITSAASSHMRNMQEQMQAQMREQERQMNQNQNQAKTRQKPKVEKEGDYIDYEEVK